ncbi:MAG: THUMP domain-containing protein [Candidatus Aminicenantes bacterium]|nr:THUMP domain-containing protein [Candidatus Aminicenantes bacterium]
MSGLNGPRLGDRAVIVRYGEISLKGKNRSQFELGLKNDLEWFLRTNNHPFSRISVQRGRIYIHDCADLPDLEKVLGVYSYSPALEIARDYETLKEAIKGFIPDIKDSADFRVSCQRLDKHFSPNSMAVEKEMGALIAEQTGTPVRLKDPAFELYIEIGQRHIYLFSEKINAFGGFPVGSAGKLVSLISGGIDSPVATFLMMKRGVWPVLLHFQVSAEEAAKVARLRDRLEAFSAGRKLKLIVQVASQTLKNLMAQRRGSDCPVYSPLIAHEKIETMALARRIGTYDLSIASVPGCTPPRSPKTGVRFEQLLKVLEETGLK